MRDIEHLRGIGKVPARAGDRARRCGVRQLAALRRNLWAGPGTPLHIVTEAALRSHREQSERLIAIARSGLDALFRQVAGQNYVLLLADAKGVTVDFFGDRRFEDDLRAAGLYLGADWSEQLAWTCGVGSCIVTGEAITTHQTDHFDLSHTPLSCTAAPIFDSTGQLAAVLDLSLLRSPQPKTSQNLAMNLVRASARRVEMANLMELTRRDWVLRLRDGRALFGHAIAPQAVRLPPGRALRPGGLSSLAGADSAMQALLDRAARLARSTVPLLICGETGTGKERLARGIHMCQPDAPPFHLLDCAGLDAPALAAQNWATRSRGTLFVRGVEDLDAEAQAMLLLRLADSKLRVIATTRCDLGARVRQGLFRPDLFFRVAGAALELPPLRLRQDFDWLLSRLLGAHGSDQLRVTPAASAELRARRWPRNLRELAATLQTAALMAEGRAIDLDDLPPPLLDPLPVPDPVDDLQAVLAACGGNMAQAARRMGVNRSTILRRMQRLGLNPR